MIAANKKNFKERLQSQEELYLQTSGKPDKANQSAAAAAAGGQPHSCAEIFTNPAFGLHVVHPTSVLW